MPYIILAFGILATLYVAYRFFVRASEEEVKQAFSLITSILFAGILIYFAVSGRIAVALGLMVLSLPIVIARLKNKSRKQDDDVIDVEYKEVKVKDNDDDDDTKNQS